MYHDPAGNEKGFITAGAVSLGSNSFRLLIAKVSPYGITPLIQELVPVRLAQDLGKSGLLSPEAMARGRGALQTFAAVLAEQRPEACRVCGTYALRAAANREQFLADAGAILGRPVEILTGDEEAVLSMCGALFFLGKEVEYPFLLADVGGGSSEFVLAPGAQERFLAVSSAIGAVSLSELASAAAPQGGATELPVIRQRAQKILRSELRHMSSLPAAKKAVLIGTGGTATALAVLDSNRISYDGKGVQGHTLSCASLNRLVETLAPLSPAARCQLPGLDNRRGEIILAGAVIYQELLAILGLKGLVVSEAGLLEGILLSGMDRFSSGHLGQGKKISAGQG